MARRVRKQAPEWFGRLTTRERRVLELRSQGYSGKEIADALQISLHTVRTHSSDAKRKMGAKSATHAAMLYLRETMTRGAE